MGVEGGYGYGGRLHPACALHDKVQQVRLHALCTSSSSSHAKQTDYIHQHTAMGICAEFQPRPCPCMQPTLVSVLASFSWTHHTG